ncbi:unnamed protein product [Adineta ricciae]|uniref:Putative auto-transporter adhesin head GIN domain-containing protein n=1 Tax=Adineta ricciae TaxID=249248 RepID=A0A814NM69_ADIRI|nr:unnamed protein product [Adineta ricciae]
MFSSILILVISCVFVQSQQIQSVVRQNRPLTSPVFDEITIDGAFDVFLIQPNEIANSIVEVETIPSVQQQIIVEVLENHVLSIRTIGNIRVPQNINVHIQLKTPLRRYTFRGTGNTVTHMTGLLNPTNDKLVIEQFGTGNLAMKFNVNFLDYYQTGSGTAQFFGQVRSQLSIINNGVGEVNTLEVITPFVKVLSSGTSVSRIAATNDVDIEVTGVGNVFYQLPSGRVPSKEITTGIGRIVRLT